MTWKTPLGRRTLVGIERDIVNAAISRMTRASIEELDEGELSVGVPLFDSINGCQQLVMLDYVKRH